MGRITELQPVVHDSLPGVVVYPLDGDAEVGELQEVLVDVEPNGTIPLHRHQVDATMVILAGEGKVLSSDAQINGQLVGKGKVVFFERHVLHGFEAGPDGLLFISKNGGIVSSRGEPWDIEFAT